MAPFESRDWFVVFLVQQAFDLCAHKINWHLCARAQSWKFRAIDGKPVRLRPARSATHLRTGDLSSELLAQLSCSQLARLATQSGNVIAQ